MEAILARSARRVREWEALRERARAALPGLVDVLVREFGARRVVLFGSMVRGFGSDEPDIDLLVEGLSPAGLAAASGRLTLLAPLPVDLVPAETGRPEVVRRALEEGDVLHES